MRTKNTYPYDVFISYRWVTPDQEWVRNQLYPALVSAGLKVFLDVEDFLPGRDLILEMERAGKESRHAICVISPDYFSGNRMVGFESLMLRRSDPSGKESRLIPLILRPAKIPERIRGLIATDWTDPACRLREWRKLLKVLKAKDTEVPAPCSFEQDAITRPVETNTLAFSDLGLPASISDLLRACKIQVEDEVKGVVGDKYIPTLYIDRAAHSGIENFISKRPSMASSFLRKTLAAANQIQEEIHSKQDEIKSSIFDGPQIRGGRIQNRKDELSNSDIDKLNDLAKTLNDINAIVPLIKELDSIVLTNNPLTKKTRGLLEEIEVHPGCIDKIKFNIAEVKHSLKNCLLIKDVAGRGKTNLVCSLASQVVEHQPAILIAAGALRLEDKFSLERYIQTALSFSSSIPIPQFMQHIVRLVQAADTEILLIVDAINENRDTHLLKSAIQAFLSQYNDQSFKCIVTCRDIYWEGFLHITGDFWENFLFQEIQLGDFTREEFHQARPLYFQRFKIRASLSKNATKKLRHPLLLRFFCEAHRGSDKIAELGVVKDIRLKPLFDTYWNNKLSSIKERLLHRNSAVIENFLLSLARKMRFNRDRNISFEDITKITDLRDFEAANSVYTRLLDESIILEQIPEEAGIRRRRRVTFVYDEFMEYVIARDIVTNTMNIHDHHVLNVRFNRLLRSANRFSSMYGVIAYLLIMLEDERHFDGWSHVYARGGKWHPPLLKSLSRVMPHNLSPAALGIADKLAQSNYWVMASDIAELARDLSRVQPDKAIPLWRTLLNTKFNGVHSMALDFLIILSNAGHSSAKEVLVEALQHPEEKIRATALYVLAALRYLLPYQVRSLSRDKNGYVREAALYAITQLQHEIDQDFGETLTTGLFDKVAEVRMMATHVVEQMNYEHLLPVLECAQLQEKVKFVKERMDGAIAELQRF